MWWISSQIAFAATTWKQTERTDTVTEQAFLQDPKLPGGQAQLPRRWLTIHNALWKHKSGNEQNLTHSKPSIGTYRCSNTLTPWGAYYKETLLPLLRNSKPEWFYYRPLRRIKPIRIKSPCTRQHGPRFRPQHPSFDQDPQATNSHSNRPTGAKRLDLEARSGRTYRGMRAPRAGSRGNSRSRRSWLLSCSVPDPRIPPPLPEIGTGQANQELGHKSHPKKGVFCFSRNQMGEANSKGGRWSMGTRSGNEIPKKRGKDGNFRSPRPETL
jgi:hypothetical protein